jgi:hypothetical protein
MSGEVKNEPQWQIGALDQVLPASADHDWAPVSRGSWFGKASDINASIQPISLSNFNHQITDHPHILIIYKNSPRFLGPIVWHHNGKE